MKPKHGSASDLSHRIEFTIKPSAEQLLGKGCKNVIITLGEMGSMFCNNHRSMYIPPYKLPKLIDSTGAGDAFNAALAVALSEEMEIEDALRFANAAGALSCTRLDTIPSFHNRKGNRKLYERIYHCSGGHYQ